MALRPRIRQLNLVDVFDESFRLYRKHFLVLVAITALVFVPYTALSTLLQAPLQERIADLGRTSPPNFDPTTPTGLWDFLGVLVLYTVGLLLLNTLYLILFQPIMEGALARAVAQYLNGYPLSIGDSFGVAVRRAPSLIGARLIPTIFGIVFSILVFSITFAVLIGLLYGVGATFFDTPAPSVLSDIGGAEVVGLVLCSIVLFAALLIVGMFCTVRILFATQAVVVEDHGAWSSIKRSWQLTQNHFWRLFGTLLLLGLLTSIISTVVSAVFVFPVQFVFRASSQTQALLSGIASAIVGVFVTPFSLIAYTLLYFDLLVRKEALDLQQQAAALQQPGMSYPGSYTY